MIGTCQGIKSLRYFILSHKLAVGIEILFNLQYCRIPIYREAKNPPPPPKKKKKKKKNKKHLVITVELQWLEHLWNHENMLETGVVRGSKC